MGEYGTSSGSMYYPRGRYLDPGLGRFVSRDPAGFQGGGNLYPYVGNAPMMGVDPMGAETISIGFGGTITVSLGDGIPNFQIGAGAGEAAGPGGAGETGGAESFGTGAGSAASGAGLQQAGATTQAATPAESGMGPEMKAAIIDAINITLDLGALVAAAYTEEGIGTAELAAYAASIGVDFAVMLSVGTIQTANSVAQMNSPAAVGAAAVPIGSVGGAVAPCPTTAAPSRF